MASGVLDIQEFVKSFGSVVIKDGDRVDKWMEVAVLSGRCRGITGGSREGLCGLVEQDIVHI